MSTYIETNRRMVMAKSLKHDAGNHGKVTDPEGTIELILGKLDTWAREAPAPTSLEEVRMMRECLVALTALVKERRAAEEGELDAMSEDELKAKARELFGVAV